MRVVFFGTPELAIPSLEAVAANHEVAAVVCQPDRPQGRGRKLTSPPVKSWAEDRGVPVVQPTKLNDGTFEAWLREQTPDICVLAAYGRILKQPILDVPPHGFINMHPSLLPKYRGPSPIRSALLEGETVTGVSIMRLDAGTDTGDVLLQEEVPIEPEDNNITLTERLAERGADLLVEALRLIAEGRAVYTPQDDSQATYTRIFTKADGRIRWSEPAERIRNRIRAALPWPAAHCILEGRIVQIHDARVVDEPAAAEPGVITGVKRDAVVVATGDKSLAVLKLQAPGKRPMAMGDYLRGRRLETGQRFEEVTD